MTNEEVDRLLDRAVQEASNELYKYAFARLIAAQEREACATIAQAWDVAYPTTNYGQCIANEIRSRK